MKLTKLPSMLNLHGFLILFSVAVLFSCSSKSELTGHIPKDASVVMTMDVKSMALKSLDFKKMFSLDNLKKMVGSMGEKDDSTKTSMSDPGLDLTGKIYLFGQALDSNRYGAMAANLSDSKKFEDFLKESDKSITITEEGNLKFASFSGGMGIIAWNRDEVLVVFGSDKPKETVLSIAKLKKEESLVAANESFKASQKEAADISLWISFDEFAKLAPQYGASLGSMNFKESYLSATCNFEDGQIVVNSKYTLNPEAADKYNFIKANLGNDVVNTLPGDSVIGLFGFAFDMEKIYNHLEKENLVNAYGQMANQMTGLTAKELLTMLSGDVAVTVNGVEIKDAMGVDSTGQLVSKKQAEPNYSAVFGIASKEKLDQLLAQLTKGGMLTKQDNYYTFQDKIFVFEKGKTLVITGSQARAKSIDGEKGVKLDAELIAMLNSNATSFYMNLVNIPEAAYGNGGEGMGKKIKQSEVQEITITATTVRDNTSTGKIVVKFKEKNENALVTLGRISKNFADLMKSPVVASAAIDSTAVVN